MKPSSVSNFRAARDIDCSDRDEQYTSANVFQTWLVVGFCSWLVKDNKSKREEKNKHIYKKTLNQKKTLNPN